MCNKSDEMTEYMSEENRCAKRSHRPEPMGFLTSGSFVRTWELFALIGAAFVAGRNFEAIEASGPVIGVALAFVVLFRVFRR